ncbi:MAG: DNA repair protein RecN [Rikenellaceae bacterium]
MLEYLSVENYALIDRLELELDPSLNIITGETGAGKSILLGALGLLLGAKNDSSATRDNGSNCVVEGRFSIGALSLRDLFEQNDWEYEDVVTIRRVITPAGKSRAFIGDLPVALADLRELGGRLIDIHSQHKNMIITDEEFRVSSIDLLYDSAELLRLFITEYKKLNALQSDLKSAEQVAANAKRDYDWLRHQVTELTEAKLRVGELLEAESELKVLENVEQIELALRGFIECVDGDDDRNMLLSLRNVRKLMEGVAANYPAAGEYAERLNSVYEELKDMNSSVSADCDSVEHNPERLAKLSDRIDLIYSLMQKHRAADLDELITIRDNYTEQLERIENSDETIDSLRKQIAATKTVAERRAAEISKRRKGVAKQFENEIVTMLRRLGIEQARFKLEFTNRDLSMNGCDRVEYLFSSVDGKSMQPVDRIASGGEISRVMLSLKALLARRMSMATIIFDEIDTGVSGRVADAMGEIIEELSGQMQVVDITHLPQVASKGESHFAVYKEQGRTRIKRLSAEQRVEQIATMLSGSTITESAVAQARILLNT